VEEQETIPLTLEMAWILRVRAFKKLDIESPELGHGHFTYRILRPIAVSPELFTVGVDVQYRPSVLDAWFLEHELWSWAPASWAWGQTRHRQWAQARHGLFTSY
jgi:hypothetical protein